MNGFTFKPAYLELHRRGVLRQLDISEISISFKAHVVSKEMRLFPQLFNGAKFIIIPGNTAVEKHPQFIRLTKGTHQVLLRRKK